MAVHSCVSRTVNTKVSRCHLCDGISNSVDSVSGVVVYQQHQATQANQYNLKSPSQSLFANSIEPTVNMLSFTVISTIALAALATASPTLRNMKRQQPDCSAGDYVSITLIGAADAEYTISAPCDGSLTPTNNVLSISHVDLSAGPCLIIGIDGTSQWQGAGYADFGPPQTITGVICGEAPQ